MTFTREDDKVTLEMTVDQWENLLLLTGIALGAIQRSGNPKLFYTWLKFINALNRTNPAFTPYEIPPEYSGSSKQ
jgi:hypothetical protein